MATRLFPLLAPCAYEQVSISPVYIQELLSHKVWAFKFLLDHFKLVLKVTVPIYIPTRNECIVYIFCALA